MLFIGVTLTNLETAAATFDATREVISETFGWFLTLCVQAFLILRIYLAVNRFGHIRIGGPGARRHSTRPAWFAVLFSANMGVGPRFCRVAPAPAVTLFPCRAYKPAEKCSYEEGGDMKVEAGFGMTVPGGLASLALVAGTAAAEPRALDDAAWRADIEAAAEHIVEHHPRPFVHTSRETFAADVGTLMAEVPTLDDQTIVLRLAEIVGSLRDGHTRLSLPRGHPEIGLVLGHSQDPEPAFESLSFRQLPVSFEQFADGVYVTHADRAQAALIGQRLVAIGGTPVAEALERAKAITYAENNQLATLMAADRLTLPAALHYLGLGDSRERAILTLAQPNGTVRDVELTPLEGDIDWIGAFEDQKAPLHARHPGRIFRAEYLPDENAVYLQMDEISNGEETTLAEFVTSGVHLADEHDARLIVDIRRNFGGSNGLNRTLVLAVIRNDRLNRYGRTIVLTGPRTFSAAQSLVNELEQYTRAVLVGESTGSAPDHFGDPTKIRLEHSGLLLRVSRLHWSSYSAFDERDATHPDFVAEWTADAYFAGGDPALETALGLEDVTLEGLLRAAFARGDLQQVGRHVLYATRAPDSHARDVSELLFDLGNEFREVDDVETASLAYRVGLYLYPDHADLANALASLTADEP